ncbi:MAG: hypothetical protein IIT49_03990, partial [Clostridia bacterium]|nr:hypothetical protein [Clostridia bacterium]
CQITGYRSDFIHLMLSSCFFMVIFFINLLSLNSDSGTIRYNQCTEQISAQVVDMVSTLDGDGNRVYAPVYEYVYQGARFTEQSPHFTNIKRTLPKIGQICTIMINPDKCQMMFEPYRTPKPVSRWVATATAIFSCVCWIIAYIL